MFSFQSTVRYSECDEHYQLSTLGLMNYMQDCGVSHTQSTEVDIAHLLNTHKAWYVTSWNIEIYRLPKLSDKLTISTWATGLHGFFASRNFTVEGTDGTRFAQADSTWILMDTTTGRPVHPDEHEWQPYEAGADKPLAMARPTRNRLKFAGTPTKALTTEVLPPFLDANHHVNNAYYIELALLASKIEHPSHIDVVYRQAAGLGDTIVCDCYPGKTSTGVTLHAPDNTVYAMVELS